MQWNWHHWRTCKVHILPTLLLLLTHSTSLLVFPQSSSDPLINLRPLVLHKSPVYGVRTRLGEGEKVDGAEDGWAFKRKSGSIKESGDMVEKRQSPVVFYAYQRDREREKRDRREGSNRSGLPLPQSHPFSHHHTNPCLPDSSLILISRSSDRLSLNRTPYDFSCL